MSTESVSASATMRAWIHHRAGSPSNVLTLAEVPRPTMKSPGEVLVRIHYAALNPAGSIMMQLCPSILRTKPCIPELDFAGEVVEMGEGVPIDSHLQIGQKVFGSIPVPDHLKGQGALGEYVVVNAMYVVGIPQGVEMREAAGLPVAGCTALALLDMSKPSKGQRVLVNGAGGGIGTLITQMVCEAVGDEGLVVAIGSTDKRDLLLALGAHKVVDHRASAPVHQFLAEEYGDTMFDLVIDAYGVQDVFLNCAGFLKEKGSYVTVGIAFAEYSYGSMMWAVCSMLKNMLWPQALGGTPRTYSQAASACNPSGLARLRDLSGSGRLKVPIDSCWSLEESLQAYERVLSRRARGKVIVQVSSGPSEQ